MTRDPHGDIDRETFESARAPAGKATSLPPIAYRSPAFFELEVERIFRKEWLCIGHVGDVPDRGSYRCIDVVGEPLVIVRGLNDEIHVLSRVCRHKWMDIVQGSGRVTALTCPYHQWTYNLDGTLRGAPHMTKCEIHRKSATRLPTLKVELWGGFVWANFDLDCAPLDRQLARLSELTRRYDLSNLTLVHRKDSRHACNWKIMVENFNDFYHHMGLHRDTLQPFFPTENGAYEPFDGAYTAFWIAPRGGLQEALSGGWPTMPGLNDQERNNVLNVGIYPNLSVTYEPELVNALLMYPIDCQTVGLSEYLLLPAETARRSDLAEGLERFNEVNKGILEEDFAGCIRVQAGVNSRLAAKGALSDLEESTRHGNHWLLDRVFPK